ncbi:hypothetical protein [Bacillus marasmi]|uniref:hypothetical protein n=1 Tax=Bacillus marasmi TaxID=1926279 RepID=UPI001FEA4E64|nr:hypothetical protein [Bacillus marasmi]
MGHIKVEDIQTFISVPVEIAIIDEAEGEQAPFVRKIIRQVKTCPDQTHLRIYFDHVQFFAVPLIAHVTQTNDAWSAYDNDSALRYTIRKV